MLAGNVRKETFLEFYLTNSQANSVLRKAVKHTCTQHNPEIPRRAPAGLMDGVLPKQNTY